jgi:aspartyl-tRNA(Asn)/glutamyl-tRNA(Gln) amidotransferase subunit B
MRSKEEAHDYRYFPEPDLPPLVVDACRIAAIRQTMPELPDACRRRFVESFALPEYDAAQLTQSRASAEYFEAAVRAGGAAKAVSNWMMGELARALKDAARDIAASPVPPERLAELLAIIEKGTISGAIGKYVFERMFASGLAAEQIVAAEGLTQIDDEAQIRGFIENVLSGNTDAVSQYRAGKPATFGFLVGQVMKAAGGRANPQRVNQLLRTILDVRVP